MQETIGIILAGGIGKRFNGVIPKQYYIINGKEMIWYSINSFLEAQLIDDFIVVLNQEEYLEGRIASQYGVHTVCGGLTRNHSFKNALDYIHSHYPECKKIIENNAACPLTTPSHLDDMVHLLDEYDYVQTTFKITDALGSYTQRLIDREDYFLIQSPDAYRFPLLYSCFNPEHPNGHPAVQLPEDVRGFNYFKRGVNFKVTYPEDIEIAELLLKRR